MLTFVTFAMLKPGCWAIPAMMATMTSSVRPSAGTAGASGAGAGGAGCGASGGEGIWAVGCALRFRLAPEDSYHAAIVAARPMQIVETAHLMYCIVS